VDVAPAPAAAAEHLPENVAEDVVDVAGEGEAFGEAGGPRVAEAAVIGALLGIGEDGIGLGALLESLLGFLAARVLVGVVLDRELPEGGLQLGPAGGAGDAEDLVVVAFGGGRHRGSGPPGNTKAGESHSKFGRRTPAQRPELPACTTAGATEFSTALLL